jgi:hypothetical protein
MGRILTVLTAFLILIAPAAKAELQATSLTQIKQDQALAATNIEPTHFTQLAAMYDAGSTPTQAELTGWFSGRCFFADDMNKMVNQLLVGFTQEISGGNSGPLFPGEKQFKIAQLTYLWGEADYFDNMTDEFKTTVSTYITEDENAFSPASLREDASMTSECSECNLNYQIKKSGDFFVAKDVVITANENHGAGQVYAMCYFFKKVN